jgi:hypothetical protein
MASEPVEVQGWDSREKNKQFEMTRAQMLDIIDEAHTCVFVRHTKDGRPVGFVVGGAAVDGEIYTVTNVLRLAIPAIEADPRCSVVFDVPGVGSVTIIGRAEVVEDHDVIRKWFEYMSAKASLVKAGRFTPDEWMERAYTPNRRLFHIIPEKWVGSDLLALQ